MATFGFCAMLLVMTYNWPVLLVLGAGLSIGHMIFNIVGLPKLPEQYKSVAGSGAYLPEADACCCKVDEINANEPDCLCEED